MIYMDFMGGMSMPIYNALKAKNFESRLWRDSF